jgi:hypothetical protein
MQKIVLSALLLLNAFFVVAQQKKKDYLKEINSFELKSAQAIISEFAYEYYVKSNRKLWQQVVRINEAQGYIECKARPATDSALDDWKIIQRIALLRIDTIYHTYDDSSVTFLTNYPFADENSFGEASRHLHFRFHAKVWNIRNISWQIWNHISKYKQKKLKELTARETVQESVLQYLFKHQYSALLTQQLLANNKLYVSKCNICNGTKDALSGFSKALKDVKWKANDDLVDSLKNENQDVQMRALETLVSRAVDDFYIQNNFSKKEIEKSQALLAAERKKSMGLAGGKKCASCDGACKKD